MKGDIGPPILVRTLVVPCLDSRYTRDTKARFFRWLVFLLTFLSYTAYHMGRKPISVVKNILYNETCADAYNDTPPADMCGWAPFDGSDHNSLLGGLDYSHVFPYSIALFVVGTLTEHVDNRYLISAGSLLGSLFTCGFGFAYFLRIHEYWYFVIMQMLAGTFHATGWPVIIECMGNWYGKKKRGFIMGLWNMHVSLGNILGTLFASSLVEGAWGWSFIAPSLILSFTGLLNFFFLVPVPTSVGCPDPSQELQASEIPSGPGSGRSDIKRNSLYNATGEQTPLLISKKQKEVKVGFWRTLRIPGVIEYSLCLFFSKLVNYVIFFWLPNYLKNTTDLDPSEAANFSIFFDIGAMIGGIVLGGISDFVGLRALPCIGSLVLSIPILFVYNFLEGTTYAVNAIILVCVGILVMGPYALITTAISADLGSHPVLKGNTKVAGVVGGIVDGTGSLGAAIGPLIAGFVSQTGWDNVFYMLMISQFMATLLLLRVGFREIKTIIQRRRQVIHLAP